MIAALFVETNGVYYNLPGVDPWDAERDARLYAGPYPVVAHPPCKVWSIMGQCRPEIIRGADGGCFRSALRAVQRFGGVLEHPAHSHAWRKFALPVPSREGWTKGLWDLGWSCEVDQRWYGHEANKPTWLYYVGPEPPDLIDGRAPKGERTVGRGWGGGREHLRSRTPIVFRDLLLAMASSASFVGDVAESNAPAAPGEVQGSRPAVPNDALLRTAADAASYEAPVSSPRIGALKSDVA